MHDWCTTEGIQTLTHEYGHKHTHINTHKNTGRAVRFSCDRPLQRVGPAGQGGHTVTPTGPRCACGTATSCFPLETSAWATTARQGLAPPILILYLVSACTHTRTCVPVLVRTTELMFFLFFTTMKIIKRVLTIQYWQRYSLIYIN